MADEQQDSQKTLVAFVVGLLIGGMLVWAFSGPSDDSKNKDTDDKQTTEEMASTTTEVGEETATNDATDDKGPRLAVGEGNIVIKDQPAASTVKIDSATYPIGEGWIGVRQYNDDNLGYILGVVRFSEEQGLVPQEIILQAPTTAGKKYAVVIYKEDGDRDFNLAGDVQLDEIFATFTAQ